jgi:hypothetical protein
VEHVALFVAIVATVERDVVPAAQRVIISMVVEEVFHRYRQLSIGYAVIPFSIFLSNHPLSHHLIHPV